MALLILSKENVDVGVVDHEERTALHLAAQNHNGEVMQALIESGKGIQLDKLDSNSKSAYDYIDPCKISSDTFGVIITSFSHNVNKTDAEGFAFLHRYCRFLPEIERLRPFDYRILGKQTQNINTLLEISELDINVLDRDRNTALYWAIRTRQADSVRSLLKHPNIIVPPIVPILLSTSLISLAPHSSSSSSRGSTYNDLPAFYHLTAKDEAGGDTAILDAFMDYSETNRHLRTNQLNLQDETGLALLSWAAKHDYVGVLEKLLEDPLVDVNLADNDRLTPLAHAMLEGRDTCAELLLRSPGININWTDDEGNTYLHLAVRYGHLHSISCLCNNPSFAVGLYNEDEETPLHLCIRMQDQNLFTAYLGGRHIDSIPDPGGSRSRIRPIWRPPKYYHNEANPNLPNRYGQAPLLYAMTFYEEGSILFVQELLNLPTIKTDHCDRNSKTTLSYFTDMCDKYRGRNNDSFCHLRNVAKRLSKLARANTLRQEYKDYMEIIQLSLMF